MTRRGLLQAALALGHKDMVRIPGGTFRMGSSMEGLLRRFPNAGPGLKSMLMLETPQHEVTVPSFRLDRHEVTNSQFRRFVMARPAWKQEQIGGGYLRHWKDNRFPAGQSDYPVVFITWKAALAFAEWAGKRLPTEAEWEFAACGGRNDVVYPWGNDAPTPLVANYAESGMHAPVHTGS